MHLLRSNLMMRTAATNPSSSSSAMLLMRRSLPAPSPCTAAACFVACMRGKATTTTSSSSSKKATTTSNKSTPTKVAKAAATSASPSNHKNSIQTPEDLMDYKKKAHALFLLRTSTHVAMSAEAAQALICDEDGAAKIPESEKMSRAEAAEFLRACHDAGAIIISPAPDNTTANKEHQMVYTDPVAVYKARKEHLDVNNKTDDQKKKSVVLEFGVDALQARAEHIASLRTRWESLRRPGAEDEGQGTTSSSSTRRQQQQPREQLATDPDEAAIAAARSHHRFWALVAFGVSCQMLLFAYWTFLVYDWDAMEPFSYFVGSFYMCMFFAYFVFFRRAHTFAEMDKAVLRRSVKTKAVA